MWYFYAFISQVCYCWCPPFSAGHLACLFICLPGLSYWYPSFSVGNAICLFICLPDLGPFPLAMQYFYSFVSQVCHWWCPPLSIGHVALLFMVCYCWYPFSMGHVAVLFICLPSLLLVISALFRWSCNVSIHLFPSFIIANPSISAGHMIFLCIYFAGLLLLVSALLRWPCSNSVQLFPRSVAAEVLPFPLAI